MSMRSYCVFFVLVLLGAEAQNVVWTDTLVYSSRTGIRRMVPENADNVFAYGGFDQGYTGDGAYSRALLVAFNRNGVSRLLDSSTTRNGAGPIIDHNSLYISFWLDGMGTTPKIAGKVYPEGNYIVKYDFSGNIAWVKSQSFQGKPNHMVVDQAGMIYIQYITSTGGVMRKYDEDGNSVTCTIPNGLCLSFDQKNNAYLIGYSQLRKFDSSGNLVWSKYAEDDVELNVDDQGNSYVLTHDMIPSLIKYDTNGNVEWNRSMPNTGNGRLRVEGDNVYVVRTNGSQSAWGPNVVTKFDSRNGDNVWEASVPFPSYRPFWPNTLTSSRGTVYFSAYEPDNGFSRTILVAIEDLSFIPVTTSLPTIGEKPGAMEIMPNPSDGIIRIHYDDTFQPQSMRILDATGREVMFERSETITGGEARALDLTELSTGVYFLEATSSSGVKIVKRIILQ
jgi:hypothetical protein